MILVGRDVCVGAHSVETHLSKACLFRDINRLVFQVFRAPESLISGVVKRHLAIFQWTNQCREYRSPIWNHPCEPKNPHWNSFRCAMNGTVIQLNITQTVLLGSRSTMLPSCFVEIGVVALGHFLANYLWDLKWSYSKHRKYFPNAYPDSDIHGFSRCEVFQMAL